MHETSHVTKIVDRDGKYIAMCSCGWEGVPARARGDAAAQAWLHRQTNKDPARARGDAAAQAWLHRQTNKEER